MSPTGKCPGASAQVGRMGFHPYSRQMHIDPYASLLGGDRGSQAHAYRNEAARYRAAIDTCTCSQASGSEVRFA